ncbi:TPA: hypothetical protein HA239_05885 [Candidatus Woesearchaeota archaeon]|nr:hypothetical protein QT06_C0001G0493 [archaeon GW2011_AR15]MBS3103804.1 hypothetical protein [Candidatus Woesearchaeota archaeon]HIH41907.1 hypothetical protein [Candidatus Woesearchaeota archaeon]
MKKLALIAIFLLLIASVSALSVRVYPDAFSSDEETLVVSFFNPGPSTLHDVSVRGYFPDFGSRTGTDEVTIKKQAGERAYLAMELPQDAVPGYYPVIIDTYNDDGHRSTTHSWVFLYN